MAVGSKGTRFAARDVVTGPETVNSDFTHRRQLAAVLPMCENQCIFDISERNRTVQTVLMARGILPSTPMKAQTHGGRHGDRRRPF